MKAASLNWEKISAIAGIFGAIAAIIALAPMIHAAITHSGNNHLFDGPIAQIAVNERGYDARGFSQDDLSSMGDMVTYRYSGHYKAASRYDNSDNKVCKLTLHANPPSTYPYGGASGFVYIQAGTESHPQQEILHNPTLVAIYQKKLDFKEYVPQECWPGNYTFPQ
jgi:hypothetical protein